MLDKEASIISYLSYKHYIFCGIKYINVYIPSQRCFQMFFLFNQYQRKGLYFLVFFFKEKLLFKKLFYLFFRGEEEEKERKRNINVWLPLVLPLLGTWLATHACALTGNQTCDPLLPRLALYPLSYTSQGDTFFFKLPATLAEVKYN